MLRRRLQANGSPEVEALIVRTRDGVDWCTCAGGESDPPYVRVTLDEAAMPHIWTLPIDVHCGRRAQPFRLVDERRWVA